MFVALSLGCSDAGLFYPDGNRGISLDDTRKNDGPSSSGDGVDPHSGTIPPNARESGETNPTNDEEIHTVHDRRGTDGEESGNAKGDGYGDVEDGLVDGEFVKGLYDAHFGLWHAMDLGQRNAVFSVFGMHDALGMVYAGARGVTASEMARALRFRDDAHANMKQIRQRILAARKDAVDNGAYGKRYDAVEIRMQSDLYVLPRNDWNAEWLDTLAHEYDRGIHEMWFTRDAQWARDYVNAAVSESTNGWIKDYMPFGAIDDSMRSLLTHAGYLRAPWNDEFVRVDADKANGDKKLMFFRGADGSQAKVEFFENSKAYPYWAGRNFQAVSIPLRGEDLAVLFILPDSGAYESVEASLNGDAIEEIFDNLELGDTLEVRIPVFSISTSEEIDEGLRGLGMTKAFAADADFDGMSDDENDVFLRHIYQNTYFSMDEKGIDARVATVNIQTSMSYNDIVTALSLERPFIAIVYESTTRAPLIIGRVLNLESVDDAGSPGTDGD